MSHGLGSMHHVQRSRFAGPRDDRENRKQKPGFMTEAGFEAANSYALFS